MLKRLVSLTVSLIVAAGDWVSDLIRAVAGTRRSRCTVLAYHAVGPAERGRFGRQMNVLLRYGQPVAADLKSLPATGGRFVVVTFDDGLENIIENALPELKKSKIPATLFIVTDLLGQNRTWEHLGGDDTRNEGVMSEQQLRQLPSELVTIASHSMTHPLMTRIDKRQLAQELLGSRLKLEKMLKQEVKLFSFPYGAFNDDVIEACRESGYQRVFTALPVFAFTAPDEFVTGRVGTSPMDWPIEFRLKIAGAYRWLPQAYSLKRWLRSLGRLGGGRTVALKRQKKVA